MPRQPKLHLSQRQTKLMTDRQLKPRAGDLHSLLQTEPCCDRDAHQIQKVGEVVVHGQARDSMRLAATNWAPGRRPSARRTARTKPNLRPTAPLTSAISPRPKPRMAEPTCTATNSSDESPGQPGFQQIGMHPVDFAGRVEPRQDVLEAPRPRAEDTGDQRGLHPFDPRRRHSEESASVPNERMNRAGWTPCESARPRCRHRTDQPPSA